MTTLTPNQDAEVIFTEGGLLTVDQQTPAIAGNPTKGIHTVPTGKQWKVKSIEGTPVSGTSTVFSVEVETSAGGKLVIFRNASPTSKNIFNFPFELTLGPGDKINTVLEWSGAPASYTSELLLLESDQ